MLQSMEFDPAQLEAISSLVAAVAWPIVVLLTALVFRRALHDFVRRMRTLEVPGRLSLTADAQAVATRSLVIANRFRPFGIRQYVEEMSEVIDRLGRSPRVLWVDDHPSNNHNELSALELLGMWVQLSTTTEDAMARIDAGEKYDVIISDMNRDGEAREGFRLLEAVRASSLKDVPFVIYSGRFSNYRKNFDEAVARGALGCSNMSSGLMQLLLRALRHNEERLSTRNESLDVRPASARSGAHTEGFS